MGDGLEFLRSIFCIFGNKLKFFLHQGWWGGRVGGAHGRDPYLSLPYSAGNLLSFLPLGISCLLGLCWAEVCLSAERALVRRFLSDISLWVLNFSGTVYVDHRLAFSILHSSSHFQIVSIHLSSFGKLKKKKKNWRRADETAFESSQILLCLALLTGVLTEGQFSKLYFPLKYSKVPFKTETPCSWLLPNYLCSYPDTRCTFELSILYLLVLTLLTVNIPCPPIQKTPQMDLPSLQ